MTDLHKKPRLIRGFFMRALSVRVMVLLAAIVHRCVQHLHHIINDRLRHILQEMRRPGMPVGVTNYRGV